MPANTAPIFTRIGDVTTNGTTGMAQGITLAAADYTGVSANNTLAFTADATNGSYIRKLRFRSKGTNVAAVARIYINNGADPTVATNNQLFDEAPLPATAASTTTPTAAVEVSIETALPAGFRVYWGLGAAVAAGWVCVGVGGKY